MSDVDSMKAGDGLNALIAERVFGEPKPPHPGNNWHHRSPHDSRPAMKTSDGGQWYMTTAAPDHGVNGRWGGWVARPYSERIEAAREMEMRLRERGLEEAYVWELLKELSGSRRFPSKVGELAAILYAPCDVRCRAALKATSDE
jgi:hypothetical protein